MPALFTPGREPVRYPIPRRLLLGVLAQVAISGCSRPRQTEDDNIHVSVVVTPHPPVTGTAHVEILLHDAEGLPVEAKTVKLEGNMSHAGMVPSVAAARRDRQGRWLAELDLTMGGDWVLLVQAELVDGREIERTVRLSGVMSR